MQDFSEGHSFRSGTELQKFGELHKNIIYWSKIDWDVHANYLNILALFCMFLIDC